MGETKSLCVEFTRERSLKLKPQDPRSLEILKKMGSTLGKEHRSEAIRSTDA